MIFHSILHTDISKAKAYLEKLLAKDCYFEIIEKTMKTRQQEKYLHLIISWFAHEYGENPEYVKIEFYKKTCNFDIYAIEKTNKFTGEVSVYFKSSRDLSKEDYSLSIERFRNWSSKEAGIYLPSPDERGFLDEIEYIIKKQKV